MGLLLPADQGGLIDWMPVLIIIQLLKHHNLQCSQSGITTDFVCILILPYKVIRELCLSKYYFSQRCLANLYSFCIKFGDVSSPGVDRSVQYCYPK